MATRTQRLTALDYMEPTADPTDTALALAQDVIRHLREGTTVDVSFVGLRGAPSSFFNVLFGEVIDACGLDALDRRVHLEFDTETQRRTSDRSYEAARQAG